MGSSDIVMSSVRPSVCWRVHSNSKFWVFAAEAFRSEKSTQTSNNLTEVRVKSTKQSNQFQYLRSFVFGNIYKFNTKLRNLTKNMPI
jgi:hypothetical protein